MKKLKVEPTTPARPSGRAPAFQFYARDFISDEKVLLLSWEERGVYIFALAHCWIEGSIPADNFLLGKLLGVTSPDVLEAVKGCFEIYPKGGSRLVQPRLEIEREKQRLWREKSAVGGHKSGKSKRENKLQAKGWLKGGNTLQFASAFASASASATTTGSPPLTLRGMEECAGGLPSARAKNALENENRGEGFFSLPVAVRELFTNCGEQRYAANLKAVEAYIGVTRLQNPHVSADAICENIETAWREYSHRFDKQTTLKLTQFVISGAWANPAAWGLISDTPVKFRPFPLAKENPSEPAQPPVAKPN